MRSGKNWVLVMLTATPFVLLNCYVYSSLHAGGAREAAAELVSEQGPRRLVCSPSEVNIEASAPVVGVIVEGRPRAYLLSALEGIEDHIFNDLLMDQPISVTYCDLDDFVRVFTRDTKGEAIELSVGGRLGDEMQCIYEWKLFGQKSDAAPLQDHAFTRTTWGDWVAEHPESEVLVNREQQL